jgi:hypothetical protein
MPKRLHSSELRAALRLAISNNIKAPTLETRCACSALLIEYRKALAEEHAAYEHHEKVSAELRAMTAPEPQAESVTKYDEAIDRGYPPSPGVWAPMLVGVVSLIGLAAYLSQVLR